MSLVRHFAIICNTMPHPPFCGLHATLSGAQMFSLDLSYALGSVGLTSAHAVISKAIKLASMAEWKFILTSD